jgi:hypothetical protein
MARREGPSDKGNRMAITLEMSGDDAARLIAAIDSGKLSEFGITKVEIDRALPAQDKIETWAKPSRRLSSGGQGGRDGSIKR